MRALLRSAIVCGCLVGGLVEVTAQPLMVHPVRVGGNIKPPTKIRDVRPVYPDIAQSARVAGIVILEITLDTDGSVTDARVLRGVPLLNDAAVDAVKQWLYTPTLLNGTPVPVIMTVTVNFSLADTPAGQAAGIYGMTGPPHGAPMAGAPNAAGAPSAAIANTNPFLIAPDRVGVILLGMTAQALYSTIPSSQVRALPRRTPRGITTDIEIALEPGGPTALVANVLEANVLQIAVRDNRFRTAEGFGVGTTLGELRRSDPRLVAVMCDRGPCAIMASRPQYTFELDATASTAVDLRQMPDAALVTAVLVARPVMPPPVPPSPLPPPRE